MHRYRQFLISAVIAILFQPFSRAGQLETNVIPFVTLNGTTNGTAIPIGFAMPSAVYFWEHGALESISNATVDIKLSLDATNYITILTTNASTTNAAIERIAVDLSNLTAYKRATLATATNLTGAVRELLP